MIIITALILVIVVCGILLVCCPSVFLKAKIYEADYADKKIDFYKNDNLSKDAYIFSFIVKESAPFVMICPGGGYEMVSTNSEGVEIAKAVNKRGYNAFVLKYRVGEKAKYPALQDDLANALKYALDNANALGVGKDGYAIAGFSAGGHLTASFGIKTVGYEKYNLPRPSALILSYPVISMYNPTHAGTRKNLLGKDNLDNKDLLDLYTVDKNVDSDYPDIYIWWCKDDLTVNPINSKNMVKALESAGVRHEEKEYQTGSHGAGLGKTSIMNGWIDNAINFWQEKNK